MYRSDWYVCVCVYDEHLLAGQDIQYLAPNSRSRYTTPFDEIINKNARLNNNQLITHYQRVRYLPRIQQCPVNNTYIK